MSISCPQCGGSTIRGDLRSGAMSFGDFFIEYAGEDRTFTGAPKPRSGIQKDNRVISFACQNCGYIGSFLERYLQEN